MKLLLFSIVLGLAAGLIRAKIGRRPYQPFPMRFMWLVVVALIPQYLVIGFPPTRTLIPDEIASATLVLSQLILLIFAWANRKTAGFWMLGFGLLLNFTVITANGGLMPITPDTVRWLVPNYAPGAWEVGERLATGKDIVLPIDETHLYFLSDRLRTPEIAWIDYRVAFSIGDVFIAIGAFWLLWAMGGPAIRMSKQEV